ncbi:MAG TPA: hypothetical protein VF814_11785 [Casimicrobiaceae bacterium]
MTRHGAGRPAAMARVSPRRRLLLGAVAASVAASIAPRTWGQADAAEPGSAPEEPNPLALSLGTLGPRLIAAGAIDTARFIAACARAGEPLDAKRMQLLSAGSDAPLAMDRSSAHFLLNFLWALGLANDNPILTRGPMLQNGFSRVAGYASTGGWTLAARPVMEIYARSPLIALSAEQQQRLEELSASVYRPCCDNPTRFPDCNHGMAMLGLLTLLAAEGRDVKALFLAAKTANRFWFPQQTLQLARYVEATRGVRYAQLDVREATGRTLFSASGFRAIAAWYNAREPRTPANGSRCAP